MSSSSVLKNPQSVGYQSIETADSTTSSGFDVVDDVQDIKPTKLQHKRRSCHHKKHRSFTFGILFGLIIAYSTTIYDNIKLYAISKYKHQHQVSVVGGNYKYRSGPHHSHPLHTLLHGPHFRAKVSIGPRPYFLINEMDDENDTKVVGFTRPGLKKTLQQCIHNLKSFKPSDFVLGHRGAALQFPEHTDRSHDAASRMGAGLIECDINLTKDKKLVCRHLRCDLHTTTDVLLIPHLAKKCSVPFKPYIPGRFASAKCCTSDFTLKEIQNEMCGRMSSWNRRAKTPIQTMHTQTYRTDLYSHDCPRIQSHEDFMQVVNANGGSYVPEFKMLDYDFTKRHDGYTRQMYMDQIISAYNTTDPMRVYPQGFIWEDLYYVVKNTPFGSNSFALDKNYAETSNMNKAQLMQYLQPLVDHGVPAVAPTMFMLLTVDSSGNIVPSLYAKVARELGLDIIAWTFERSESLSKGGGWYYSSLSKVLRTDSDMIKVLDVLYEDVGIKAVFTDWPSVVTFYANCKGIALR